MMFGYDPQSYEEASHDPIWKTSMQEEFKSLQDNETWELIPLPSKSKPVQCMWVYQNNIDGYVLDINYKSSLFFKGFSQFHGVYYR